MTSIANIYVALPTGGELYRFARRNLERVAFAISVAVIVWQRGPITSNFASGAWSLDGFYGAVFNWSSIQVGFLFGAYAFFLSRSEPFIQAVSASVPFMELRAYVRRTMYLTMGLAAASAPMLITRPKMEANVYLHPGFIAFAAFASVLIYAVFCLLKVIRVFGKLERPR